MTGGIQFLQVPQARPNLECWSTIGAPLPDLASVSALSAFRPNTLHLVVGNPTSGRAFQY